MTTPDPRTILISGASRGIGLATALRFAALGDRLLLLARDADRLAAARAQALAAGAADALAFSIDLADEEALETGLGAIARQTRRLDALVNSAGIMSDSSLLTTRSQQLQQLLKVNVAGSYALCQFAARLMLRQRRGVIINLASRVGEAGAAGQSAYAASKAAVSGLTRALAKELGPLGIRVNAVAPGFIRTDLTAHYPENQRQALAERAALRRLGDAEEVAELIVFLASPQAAYITGQVIAIDGGLSL